MQAPARGNVQHVPAQKHAPVLVADVPVAVGNAHAALNQVKQRRHAVQLHKELLAGKIDFLQHVAEQPRLMCRAKTGKTAARKDGVGICAHDRRHRDVLPVVDDGLEGLRHARGAHVLLVQHACQRVRQPDR